MFKFISIETLVVSLVIPIQGNGLVLFMYVEISISLNSAFVSAGISRISLCQVVLKYAKPFPCLYICVWYVHRLRLGNVALNQLCADQLKFRTACSSTKSE